MSGCCRLLGGRGGGCSRGWRRSRSGLLRRCLMHRHRLLAAHDGVGALHGRGLREVDIRDRSGTRCGIERLRSSHSIRGRCDRRSGGRRCCHRCWLRRSRATWTRYAHRRGAGGPCRKRHVACVTSRGGRRGIDVAGRLCAGKPCCQRRTGPARASRDSTAHARRPWPEAQMRGPTPEYGTS